MKVKILINYFISKKRHKWDMNFSDKLILFPEVGIGFDVTIVNKSGIGFIFVDQFSFSFFGSGNSRTGGFHSPVNDNPLVPGTFVVNTPA